MEDLDISPRQFVMAGKSGDLETIDTAITHKVVPINIQDEGVHDNKSCLMLACEHNRAEVVQYLLKQGANMNLQDAWGYTALMLAAQMNSCDAIRLLLQNGVNCDLKNKDGQTALDIAETRGGVLGKELECVNILRSKDFSTPSIQSVIPESKKSSKVEEVPKSNASTNTKSSSNNVASAAKPKTESVPAKQDTPSVSKSLPETKKTDSNDSTSKRSESANTNVSPSNSVKIDDKPVKKESKLQNSEESPSTSTVSSNASNKRGDSKSSYLLYASVIAALVAIAAFAFLSTQSKK